MAGPRCPICEWETRDDAVPDGDACTYDCPRCDPYVLTGTVQATILSVLRRNLKNRALVSHRLRLGSLKTGLPIQLDTHTLDHILEKYRLPTPRQQADSFLLWVGDNQVTPSEYIKLLMPDIGGVIGTSDVGPDSPTQGVVFIVQAIEKQGLVELASGVDRCRLTLEGSDRYTELLAKRDAAESASASVAEAPEEEVEEEDNVIHFTTDNAVSNASETVSVTTTTPSAGTAPIVPASDRTVTIDHNSPDYKITTDALTRTIETMRGNNEYAAADPDDHGQRMVELEAGAALLKGPRINLAWLKAGLIPTLRYLANKFGEAVIGALASAVIAGLILLFHSLL